MLHFAVDLLPMVLIAAVGIALTLVIHKQLPPPTYPQQQRATTPGAESNFAIHAVIAAVLIAVALAALFGVVKLVKFFWYF